MHADDDDLTLAHLLADHAGAAILPHFRSLDEPHDKNSGGAFDPVTEADRRAEAVMREHLSMARPDDGVLGEEQAAKPSANGRTWILDPVDGTQGFLMGLPTWGTLIALTPAPGAAPTVGIMDQPFVRERFAAGPDGVVWRQHGVTRKISTRGCKSLSHALAVTTSPFLFDPANRQKYDRLAAAVRTTRFGTDCYGYSVLAAGQIDIVMEQGLRAYDIAPFVPIVEGAGGIVTDFSGEPIGPKLLDEDFNGEALALGDPRLLPHVLDVLNG